MSLASNLLVILAQDAGGALATQLQNFQAGVDGAPSVEGAVAAGLQFESGLLTSLPGVEGKLIKDTTDLLVKDAVTEITTLQQQAASAANPPPVATPTPTPAPTAPAPVSA